jgi:hypothetical protein
MIEFNLQNILHYADILAIPFFLIAFIYFVMKKNKTVLEIILMLFVLCGFILDSIFSYNFLIGKIINNY